MLAKLFCNDRWGRSILSCSVDVGCRSFTVETLTGFLLLGAWRRFSLNVLSVLEIDAASSGNGVLPAAVWI